MTKGWVIVWNICPAQKQRRSGAFQKDGYKNFARKTGVSKIGYMWLIPKDAEKPTDGRLKIKKQRGNKNENNIDN